MRDGHREEVQVYTHGRLLQLAMQHIIGNFELFAKYWVMNKVIRQDGVEVSEILQIPYTGDKYLALGGKWSRYWVTNKLGVSHKCNFTNLGINGFVSVIGSLTLELHYLEKWSK